MEPGTRRSPAEVTETREIVVLGDPMSRKSRPRTWSGRTSRRGWDPALHFVYYKFACNHQTIKTTPAIIAGIADHVCSFRKIVC